FVVVEAKAAYPMVPLSLFRSRGFGGANLLTLLFYSAIGIFFFLFPLNLIQVQRYSPAAAGAAVLPVILLSFSLSRWSGGLVARYGQKARLTIGPIMAAAGFALFMVPSVGGSYWRTFFPALLMFGLGLSVTVPPLTTVVMNSADQDRVGTASGINHAVARVAGVLAIAILGIVMVSAFGSRLNASLTNLGLPTPIQQQLQESKTKLAGLQAPPELDTSTRNAVRMAIDHAFIFGFRMIMLI